jgi:hypothetical protein
MYQLTPGKPYTYVEPTITIDNQQLPITKQFTYLGSVLSNNAQMDEDIKSKISKASSACGRLQERVWKPRGIKLNTKIQVGHTWQQSIAKAYLQNSTVTCMLNRCAALQRHRTQTSETKLQSDPEAKPNRSQSHATIGLTMITKEL